MDGDDIRRSVIILFDFKGKIGFSHFICVVRPLLCMPLDLRNFQVLLGCVMLLFGVSPCL
jgi:hypothetical protein